MTRGERHRTHTGWTRPGALLLGLAAGLVLAACGSSSPSSPSSPSAAGQSQPPSGPLPTPVVDITTLGCTADGATDCRAAFTQAVQRLDSSGGGTVYFPAGSFLMSGGLDIAAGKPIDIAGAGRDQSKLVEGGGAQLLKVHRDGVVIQDLTLDTQTHNGRAALAVVANHTTLQRAHVLCGDQSFCLYYAGPSGASPVNLQYNVGNQVRGITISDLYHDDGFSWSFQQAGTISDITHTGSRLALYIDSNVTVTNYSFTPGPQAPRGTDGFYITPPSDSVTIRGFVSQGSGGIIGSDHATKFGSAPRISTNITIDGEQVAQNGYRLLVGDVQNLTLENCHFAGSSQVVIKPTLTLQHLHVQNCTIPSIQFAPAAGAQLADIVFANDTFPAFQPAAGQDPHTFASPAGAAVAFSVQGGAVQNGAGLVAGGLRPSVSSVVGY